METKVKRREWVKTAAIVFLSVLLVLTFFSNTIMNASLPEVAAEQVTSGSINARIRGSAMVSANETYDVTISQTRKISSVKARVGQQVLAGDVLFVLEAEESEELKAAQQTLEQMQLSYDKSLIDASNSAAQENREVQKAKEAYDEAVAVYQRYSDLDASELATVLAQEEEVLRQLQRESDDIQDAYTDASTDPDYTQAQSDMAALESEVASLQAQIEQYQEDLDSYEQADHGSLLRQISDKQQELANAKNVLSSDKVLYQNDYNLLMTVAGQDKTVAAAYAKDPDVLAQALLDGGYVTDEEPSQQEIGDAELVFTDSNSVMMAKDLALAYQTLQADQKQIDDLQLELDRLNEDLSRAQSSDEASRDKIEEKLAEAESALSKSNRKLREAEDVVESFEKQIEKLRKQSKDAAAAVEDQQVYIETLNSASGAAQTVESAREAWEDLVFQQSLADGSNLDMQAAKDAIEEQKKQIETLTANADAQEVTAKVGGVISEIYVTAGNSIGADTPLASINVADRGYTIKIPVTMEQAKKVKIGDTADLVNYWGSDVEAVLESLANDPSNPGKGKLLVFRLTGDVEPNQNLTLSIGQKSSNYDALVPNSAVRTDNNGAFVLVLVAKNTPLSTRYIATRVNVEVLAADDMTSAVSGLSQGDFVITTATKPIEAGMQVRLVDNG